MNSSIRQPRGKWRLLVGSVQQSARSSRGVTVGEATGVEMLAVGEVGVEMIAEDSSMAGEAARQGPST